MPITVRRPNEDHRQAWNRLYAGYAEFYRVRQTQQMRDRVWAWIQDESEDTECFLALDGNGVPMGLAHFRGFARPLSATRGCFLDDLFIEPVARGGGAAQALMSALREEAQRRDWSVVRWITAEDNYRARAMYDGVATKTAWLTYDMQPKP